MANRSWMPPILRFKENSPVSGIMRRNKLQTIIVMSCYGVIRLRLTAIMAGGLS